MKVIIECWMNHHFPLSGTSIRLLNDLYDYIHRGWFNYKETNDFDQKVTITIEVEE